MGGRVGGWRTPPDLGLWGAGRGGASDPPKLSAQHVSLARSLCLLRVSAKVALEREEGRASERARAREPERGGGRGGGKERREFAHNQTPMARIAVSQKKGRGRGETRQRDDQRGDWA